MPTPHLTQWKIVLFFSVWQLLVVGTIGTWAVRRYRFPYLPLVPLTLLAYAGAGHLAALAGGRGAIAGGLVALVEFSVPAAFRSVGLRHGWSELTSVERWVTVGTATLAGAACGLAGAWLWA
jgi:hypothetical protein